MHIDLAAHWVADEGWGEPDEAGSAFDVLADRGVIGRETATALRGAVGLRNRIAHGYALLDYTRVHREAQAGIPAVRDFLLERPRVRKRRRRLAGSGTMISKTFTATIVRNGPMCFIPLTFDPRAVFGKVRAPVKVTLNGYTYRSTIAAMGPPCIPLRKSNREAAGLEGGETLEVRLDLDTDKREVKPPADFVKALKSTPQAWDRWRTLSYSHQREHVEAIEQAKKPETRARRIAHALRMIRSRSPDEGRETTKTKKKK